MRIEEPAGYYKDRGPRATHARYTNTHTPRTSVTVCRVYIQILHPRPAHREHHRTFVVVRLDMSNGYNAASHMVLLRRLASHPELDNVSNLSCQPLRAPPRSPAKGGRISSERSRGPDYCVK